MSQNKLDEFGEAIIQAIKNGAKLTIGYGVIVELHDDEIVIRGVSDVTKYMEL